MRKAMGCPISCHISRKGGGPLTISAVNCVQPGCGDTRLCQEVVLDDTLKFSSSLSALQQGRWALGLDFRPENERCQTLTVETSG